MLYPNTTKRTYASLGISSTVKRQRLKSDKIKDQLNRRTKHAILCSLLVGSLFISKYNLNICSCKKLMDTYNICILLSCNLSDQKPYPTSTLAQFYTLLFGYLFLILCFKGINLPHVHIS